LRNDKTTRFAKDSPILSGWPAGPFGTTYAGDIMEMNLRTLDFSAHSEFLAATTYPGDLMMVNLKSPDFSPLSEFLAGTIGIERLRFWVLT
jgi:hypothetical protein